MASVSNTRNAVVELRRQRQRVGQLLAMQRRQHIGRGLIALDDRRGGSPSTTPLAAEIFGDQESRIEVGMMDRRRGEAVLAQAIGDGDERLDVFGKMNRGAVGFAVIDRRSVGTPRRVHQDEGDLSLRISRA